MTTETIPTAAEVLALYRSNHRIALEQAGDEYRCAVDGIRVLKVASRLGDQRWRHDPGRIVALLEATYGGPWGGPKAFSTDKMYAVERIVETVAPCECECPDCEGETHPRHDDGREGHTEFNGSFR